jgi:hypothetical protein
MEGVMATRWVFPKAGSSVPVELPLETQELDIFFYYFQERRKDEENLIWWKYSYSTKEKALEARSMEIEWRQERLLDKIEDTREEIASLQKKINQSKAEYKELKLEKLKGE